MEATKNKGSVEIIKGNSQDIGEQTEETQGYRNNSEIKSLPDVVFKEGEEKKFLRQIEEEYKFATRGLDGWVDKNLERLKLYNNQMRKAEYVGEPLLFTHMNTWIASLFDDKHDKEWIPAEEGDIKTAENLNALTDFDYEVMGMDEIKFYLIWDMLFFSYGLVDMLEFDADKKCPAPVIIDPLVFYYDTLASSIDGNAKNKNGMRFLGWRLYISEKDVKESGLLYDDALEVLKKCNKDTGGGKINEARQKRMEAIGGTYQHISNTNMGDNNVYEVVEHRTNWKGSKVVVVLTQDLQHIVGCKELPKDKGRSISWFVGDVKFNPQPNQYKGVSLPDILEDKQRSKAILLNDTIRVARSAVYGSYAYDAERIKNVADLRWGIDKFIPVTGNPNDVIVPIRKFSPDMPLLSNMLDYMDVSAQTASATPLLQQGVVSEQQRTLGELELVASSSKTRYSLALKTFAMGEKRFWELYYLSLKIFFKEGIGEKVVRIVGSPNTFRKLTRDDIICKTDPDVRIESRTLQEARKIREFNQYQALLGLLLQDPEADKRASIKHGLYLAGLSKDDIDVLLPPTSDELIAREQNILLSQDKPAKFLMNDNHLVHLREHKEARDTKAKTVHMKLHLDALMKIQENPQLAPQEAGMQQGEESGVPATASAPTPAPQPPTGSEIRGGI